ncbi:glutamine amidotransferase [uncultured Cohaesibacter sp.]|uniref:glutamine amidotransferase n=1 Tax=uncultured Cohaesibacter sp. TaxID=1002546 RepID=UPI00293019D4|nr:glutamine amidotransferase [uncultured Cohaesibacter sp.]
MRKILVILHQENSTPGRVGSLLEQRGFELDIRKPRFGETLPSHMDEHAGAIIFGGPMSANDGDDFVKREIDWISVPLKEKKPFVGICLGAQMMTKQLGGEVKLHADGLVERGYYEITPTECGKGMFQWPGKVYQWHKEGFSLPKGADLLATGHYFANQAMRYGDHAYAIQFHPEVTAQMMLHWTTVAADMLKTAGARPKGDHFRERSAYDPDVERWLNQFLDVWIGKGLV